MYPAKTSGTCGNKTYDDGRTGEDEEEEERNHVGIITEEDLYKGISREYPPKINPSNEESSLLAEKDLTLCPTKAFKPCLHFVRSFTNACHLSLQRT